MDENAGPSLAASRAYWVNLAHQLDEKLLAAGRRNNRWINVCALLLIWAVIATAVAVVQAVS